MRIGTIALSIALVLFPTAALADVTAVSVRNSDKTAVRIFYSGGKEIARQIIDKGGNVTKTNGKIPDGVVKEYDENGKLAFEWKYKSSRLEGMSKEYSLSGTLIAEKHYRNNKREGVSKKYYKSGKLLAERNFKEDKLEGMTKMYYESGIVFAELNYKNGNLDGTNNTYYESGILGSEEIYKNSQKIRTKSYDQQGKLLFDHDYTAEKSLSNTTTIQLNKGNKTENTSKK